jgi:hypothetical protein
MSSGKLIQSIILTSIVFPAVILGSIYDFHNIDYMDCYYATGCQKIGMVSSIPTMAENKLIYSY